MGKLTHLMIHCAATIDGQDIRPEDIERMHMGAKVYANGTVHYKGKKYPNMEALPSDDFIGDVPAKKTRGRGWSRVGYSKFWTLDGEVHTLREYDEDNWIDNNEYTNGALGMNSKTRHFCYAGGLSKDKRRGRRYAFLTMTKAQEESLIAEIKSEIKNHPHILVCGHNQYANKGCPSMNTVLWLNVHGIPEENIDKSRMRTVLQPVFENKYEGNDFRKWVNDNHPDYAREIDLDASGSHTNDYITKAYYKLRHEYNAQNKDS